MFAKLVSALLWSLALGLKEIAKRLGEAQKKKEELRRNERVVEMFTKCAKGFLEKFGCAPQAITIDDDMWANVFCDEMHLRAHSWADTIQFHLVGHCPDCREECMSKEITNIEELGIMLVDFEPCQAHKCYERRSRRPRY